MALCLLFEHTDELRGPQRSARMRVLTNGAQLGFVFTCTEIPAPAARGPASLPLLQAFAGRRKIPQGGRVAIFE